MDQWRFLKLANMAGCGAVAMPNELLGQYRVVLALQQYLNWRGPRGQ